MQVINVLGNHSVMMLFRPRFIHFAGHHAF
ncbi:Uncharacterised protein [Vibrio cholerae]|nr:Uncharacterised protein [Vibrio cholerae]